MEKENVSFDFKKRIAMKAARKNKGFLHMLFLEN